VAAVSALPAAAQAHHHHDDDDRPRVRVDFGRIELGFRSWPVIEVTPAPCTVYEDRATRIWVEPVCRTVVDRVWVDAQFEDREIHRGRGIYRDRVCVRPAHFEDVTRQEVAVPSHYETRIERVQVLR